ncbi:MAG: 5-carboxymethyl-2-hydroxymuconate Delta-isomerase [Pseudomonadota bacterium]
MPHCIVEYSKELEAKVSPSELLTAVYRGALKSGLFVSDDIKTRSVSYENHTTGERVMDFIHVTAKILSGRSDALRANLSNCILAELTLIDLSSITLTVEICDMDRASYAKTVK